MRVTLAAALRPHLFALAVLSCLEPWSFGAAALAQETEATAPTAAATDDAIGFGPEPPATNPPTASSSSDDALGFDSQTPTASSAPASTASASAASFRLGASLRLQSALRSETAEPNRIAKLRQVLDLDFEFKLQLDTSTRLRALAGIHTEADYMYLANLQAYDRATIASEAWQVWPAENFLALASSHLELSAGYQIVNLGQGEMNSLFDVVNPRDLREPVATDLSTLRLPVLMTRIGISVEPVRIEGIVVHEAYFGLTAPPLGEMSPFRRLLLESPSVGNALIGRNLSNEHRPAREPTNLRATQAFGRISIATGSVDLALLAGSALDRFGVPSLPDATALNGPDLVFPVVHPRYTLLGHTGAFTAGAFVVRWELGLDLARPFAVQRTDSSLLHWLLARRNMASGLLGISYSPSLVTSTAVELSQSYVVDNPNRDPTLQLRTLFPMEATQIAFRFNQRFLSERAGFGLVVFVIGLAPLNAWAARAELSYALLDRLEVAAGYVTYQPTRNFGFFYGLSQHDRIFLNLRWDLDTD